MLLKRRRRRLYCCFGHASIFVFILVGLKLGLKSTLKFTEIKTNLNVLTLTSRFDIQHGAFY